MKTQLLQQCKVGFALLKILFASLLISACQKDSTVAPQTECSSLDTEKPYGTDAPHYNLNVFLKGSKSTSCGYVEFRQETDGAQFIHLDTWVHGLEANTSYVLQRAVDTTIDGNCTSTTWLTLGKGLTDQSINTDSKGSGYAELYRSVSMIAVGTTFDIHFQILKSTTSEVVLSSDCFQYTVR